RRAISDSESDPRKSSRRSYNKALCSDVMLMPSSRARGLCCLLAHAGEFPFDVRAGDTTNLLDVRRAILRARRLAQRQHQLAAEDIGMIDELEPILARQVGEARPRVVRDVLVLVAAWREKTVQRLDHAPPDGRVIGRAEDEQAARPQ